MATVSQGLSELGFKFHSHKISIIITDSREQSKNQIYMVAFPENLSLEVSIQAYGYICL